MKKRLSLIILAAVAAAALSAAPASAAAPNDSNGADAPGQVNHAYQNCEEVVLSQKANVKAHQGVSPEETPTNCDHYYQTEF